MKTLSLRLIVLATLILSGQVIPAMGSEGPIPQPACIPGDAGCPKAIGTLGSQGPVPQPTCIPDDPGCLK